MGVLLCVGFLFCGVFLMSNLFSNHLAEEEIACCFTLIVSQGATSWSMVCDCGISRSYLVAVLHNKCGKVLFFLLKSTL